MRQLIARTLTIFHTCWMSQSTRRLPAKGDALNYLHPLITCNLTRCNALVQTARFDRHLVRDLTWSRHQLEDLARRRLEVRVTS